MPINVYYNYSMTIKKIDTSLFVQKHYLRSNFIECKIEEDVDLKKLNTELKTYKILLALEKLVIKILLILNPEMLLISIMLN